MSAARGLIEARFRGRLGAFSLDVDFHCPDRGITALFGPSGCGKTTILRCVAGLNRMAGAFRVDGEPWQDDATGCFRRTFERSIGYVFQESSLFPHLSVRRNLEYGLRRIRPAARRVTFTEAVNLLGVGGFLDRPPGSLSGGQRQRVAIARALLTSPRLLLMDEPMASLDRKSRDDILPYLERLHGELDMPVFYVSHTADEITRLADHLVLLDDGRVLNAGSTADLGDQLDLGRDRGVGAVIDAVVVTRDKQYHLSSLEFPGGLFSVIGMLPVGEKKRLMVRARDVSITLDPQSGTSILNIFPATVTELTDNGEAEVLVRLDVGGTALPARITRKSASVLGLARGCAVYAQVKSVALLD